MKELKGTGVAMVTPFNADGSVNYDHLEKLTDHLVQGGVDYLVVLGTTGESVTLTKQEKEDVLDCVVSANAGRLPVVLGVGGNNTSAVCTQLKNLDKTGLTAILSVSPMYNKPTQDGIYAHYEAISDCSPLPIILYNVPSRTGSNMAAETTLRLAHDFENIVAIKEASGSLDQCMRIIKDRPADFLVISGDDNFSLPLIACGGDGVISVVANALPKQYSELIRASLASDYETARSFQYQLFDIVNLLFAEGNPGGVKCALQALGICEENMRLPLVPVSDKLRQQLTQTVRSVQ
ncbi:MAG: 4-hydroxy-tetrahydrodipicolinate synthase [Flavobacteriales bacterium]|nr:4-hydroxy-tetrahydrodipicolinate synthase [Flavobacteriales bacterium]